MKNLKVIPKLFLKNIFISDQMWYHNVCLLSEPHLKFFLAKTRADYRPVNIIVNRVENVQFSVTRRSRTSHFQYFTNLICRNGNRLKAQRMLKWAFKTFFELFLFYKSTPKHPLFSYYNVLKSYIGSLPSFFNINFFLGLMLPLFECMFAMKLSKSPIKNRKSHVEEWNQDVVFLKRHNRKIVLLRFLYYYTNSFHRYKMRERLFCVLVYSFLNFKKSLLYKRKLSIYRKALLRGRFYDKKKK